MPITLYRAEAPLPGFPLSPRAAFYLRQSFYGVSHVTWHLEPAPQIETMGDRRTVPPQESTAILVQWLLGPSTLDLYYPSERGWAMKNFAKKKKPYFVWIIEWWLMAELINMWEF